MEQLSKRQTELNNSFYDCLHTLRSWHQQATQEIIPDFESHHELSQEDKEWILDYLQDIGMQFKAYIQDFRDKTYKWRYPFSDVQGMSEDMY